MEEILPVAARYSIRGRNVPIVVIFFDGHQINIFNWDAPHMKPAVVILQRRPTLIGSNSPLALRN